MKLTEYAMQIDRLCKVYGQNKYPGERVDMIYESIGSIEIEVFKKQVSYFIASMEKAPMLNDFTMALGSLLIESKNKEKEGKLKLIGPCFICNGTGHATMYGKNNGYEYAFQCSCARGKILQPCFPEQYAGMGESYVSHRAWAAGRYDRKNVIRNYKMKEESLLCSSRDELSLQNNSRNNLFIEKQGAENEL
jgi:hypothetical protein